jgi:hypothetical protein
MGMLETTRSAACIRSQIKRLGDIVVHFALAREDSYLRLWSFSSFHSQVNQPPRHHRGALTRKTHELKLDLKILSLFVLFRSSLLTLNPKP